MSIEIGQQGQYPTREVRRIPISPQVLVRSGQRGHGHAVAGGVQANGARAVAGGQRMISEVSSVFASGSEFDTDSDPRLAAAAAAGASRSRSETRTGSAATAAHGDRRTATTMTTESRQSRRTNPVPKGSLAERWRTLNDEFQDRFAVNSSGADAGKASGRRNVSRISNFERFDNVKQVFAEGNDKRSVVRTDGREGEGGTNETKVFQYERSTTDTGFVDSKPTRKDLDSFSKHSRSVLSTESSKNRKNGIRGVKTSKTARIEDGFENRVHTKRAGFFKRGEKVRKKEKGVKSVRKVEEKTAEFVDELLDDAFSSCLPTKRRSISMLNLSNSTYASPYRRSTTNEEHLSSRRTRNDKTENEELRRNAINGRYQENSRKDWRYIKSSFDSDGEAGRQTGRHFSGGQRQHGSKWRSSREENIENVRSFHTKADGKLDAVMTGSSPGLGIGYRRAQSHQIGRELTHVIRPIPGSGIYTRRLSGGSSSRRRGSGSSDQWIPYSHSEGYVSDTALSSRSTAKQYARYEGEQRGWYQPSESRTKESRRIGQTSDDSNFSSTFKIRQKCWSHDDLVADTRTIAQETGVRKSRPPTLTKGLITRIFHGSSAETTQSSPTNTVYLDSFSCRSSELGSATPHSRQSWSQFQSENDFGHATRVPVRDDLNPSSRPSRSIAAGETHLLEILPYESLSSARSSQQSASPVPRNWSRFAESSSRISRPGAGPPSPLAFSNLPIVVSDVLSPTDSVRPSTSASIYSDPGSAGTTLPSANVRMTRDQELNFYVFSNNNDNNGQQKPGKQHRVECEEITKSIYLGDEDHLRRSMMLTNRETQTTGNGQPMRTQVLDVQRSNRYEHEQPRRISGHKETVHYITHQREIEKIPEKVDKRRVESISTQTDHEVPVAPRSRQDEQRTVHVSVEPKEMVDEDELKETSSFDEFWTKTQYPYETVELINTGEPAPVKVSVVRHSAEVTETEPTEEEEEEDIVETTVVEEKEEKIQMEIREEVEFSMLRKKGTPSLVLDSDGGRVSVEPWWIPDKYEAVVDRRKIKTTKSEHKLNDEDYSFKQERHLLKEPGTTSSVTGRQIPVQAQRRDYRSSKIPSPDGGQNLSSTFVSQRTFTQPLKGNRFTRNAKHGDQVSRYYSGNTGGHFDESGSRSRTGERYSQISSELPGRYHWNGRKKYADGKTTVTERIGSSYEPNNVSFGRKSDEMVLREMHRLKTGGNGGGSGSGGSGRGGTWSIGSVETGSLPMGYEGGVVYSSQSAPVSETRLLRDEDGGVVKVTDRKHVMTKTVAYPDSSSLVGSSSVREGHEEVASLEEVLGVSTESGISSSAEMTEILNSLESGYEDSAPQESGNSRNAAAAAAGGSFMHFETVATSL